MDKIKRLDALGFVWDPVDQSWEERFRELVAYKKKHGDCLVGRSWQNKQLVRWVVKQRAKRGTLPADKIERLDALGFEWDPYEQCWQNRFIELVAYKKKHGDCLVGGSWQKKQLVRWVAKQRSSKGTLSSDKIKRLDALGFVWDADEQRWEDRFIELVAYKKKHGDCLVPQKWRNNKQLAAWVGTQRLKKRKATLSSDKIKRLNALGFVWTPGEQVWEQRLRELIAYKKKHGDCLVPYTLTNKQLAVWVVEQRQSKRKATLSSDKIKRLDALGFVWDPVEQIWEERFIELVAYKKKHGDCLVPPSWKNKQLATWVTRQRENRRKANLSSDRLKRLDALGFVWDPIEQTWEERFRELVAYKRKHGHCLVPQKWTNKQLGSWVNTQRLSKRKDTLPSDKIKRLDALGFVWDIRK